MSSNKHIVGFKDVFSLKSYIMECDSQIRSQLAAKQSGSQPETHNEDTPHADGTQHTDADKQNLSEEHKKQNQEDKIKDELKEHEEGDTLQEPMKDAPKDDELKDDKQLDGAVPSGSGETAQKQFSCYICDMIFLELRDLIEHIGKHPKKKPPCVVCAKGYDTVDSAVLLLNRNVRTDSKDSPFKCPVCLRPFSNISVRDRHSREHNGDYTYKFHVRKNR